MSRLAAWAYLVLLPVLWLCAAAIPIVVKTTHGGEASAIPVVGLIVCVIGILAVAIHVGGRDPSEGQPLRNWQWAWYLLITGCLIGEARRALA